MKKSKVKLGMNVTCKTEVVAYSETAWDWKSGKPRPMFKLGMIGVISVVDVPSVCRARVSFCCVDFINTENKLDRCALLYDNTKPA